mmetsp:Transcript_27966/g.70291  ORF Transcript_27966/g.70291 Transcript_27966/m.70291 type:complete len:200 (+) Transcript_27966:2066-2665(+)
MSSSTAPPPSPIPLMEMAAAKSPGLPSACCFSNSISVPKRCCSLITSASLRTAASLSLPPSSFRLRTRAHNLFSESSGEGIGRPRWSVSCPARFFPARAWLLTSVPPLRMYCVKSAGTCGRSALSAFLLAAMPGSFSPRSRDTPGGGVSPRVTARLGAAGDVAPRDSFPSGTVIQPLMRCRTPERGPEQWRLRRPSTPG